VQVSNLITTSDPDHARAEAHNLLLACGQDSPIYDLLMRCVENSITSITEAIIVSDNAADINRGRIHALRELRTFRDDVAKFAQRVIDSEENA
jgi:hypothetical protein